MKPSSVAAPSTSVDVAANCRAALARGRISSSRLSRVYGGAHSYWTRRLSGDLPLSDSDIQLIALACEIHPAELFGGTAPLGWVAPPALTRLEHAALLANARARRALSALGRLASNSPVVAPLR